MPSTLGDVTKTLFLAGPESHKLHLEFEVETGQTVKKGQMVFISGAGKITPAGTDALEGTLVGISIHDGVAGDLVTVAMRGYAVIYAEASGAVTPGPVAAVSGVGTEGYPQVASTPCTAAAEAVLVMGWSIDNVSDTELCRVIIKG